MALQKAYNVKIFSLSGTFGKVLSERIIQNEVSFSGQVWGWQGEITIQLAEEIDSTIVAYNNIIRVYESDTTNNGVLIYTGVVTSIVRISQWGRDYIEIRAMGLATLLTWIYFYSGGYIFTKNQEIATTIENVVDYFNTVYPWLISYTGPSIENTGITSNFSFEYTKCLDAIKRVAEGASYLFYIGADGVLQYHPKTWGVWEVTHFLTIGKDIEEIRIDENSEEVINKYLLTWNSGTITAQDATSQSNYGIHELRESNTSILDVGSANAYGASYIANNKDMKRRIKIVVNSEYNIETIRPGDLVTVRNFEYDITSLKIQKIEYNGSRINLELEEITSLAREIARI